MRQKKYLARLSALGICLTLVLATALSVSASSISKLTSHTAVERGGSCQVTLTATVQVDKAGQGLTFPVPGDATAVTVNGSRVHTTKSGDTRWIDLDRILGKMTGEFSLAITYGLPDVIHQTEDGVLQMRIPLLAGFAYPIEAMEFSVTLPGEVDTLPGFESGYYKANIERDIQYEVNGATISGTFTAPLKDRETLDMKLVVSPEMFPQTLADVQDFTFGIVGMAVCAGLALLYWLVALRFLPWRRAHNTLPVEGYTAGQMGCIRNLQGMDLHLTVLTWAELGYLFIHVERHGKVVLHKRMDMGNERPEQERRLFAKLFGTRQVVDTSSAGYAKLTLQARKTVGGVAELIRPQSGNPKVFRFLAAGIGLFGGICLAIALSGGAVLQGLLILIFGALGAISGWYVQSWGSYLFTNRRRQVAGPLVVCGLWLIVGLICGAFSVAFWMALGLLAAGILLSWAGRRTDLGKQTVAQVAGLRRYLTTADKLLVQRLQDSDPDFFFSLLPYALALGVEKPFAARFGGTRLAGCGYLTTGMDAHMTASEWTGLFQRVLESMDRRARQMPMEKGIRTLRSLRR